MKLIIFTCNLYQVSHHIVGLVMTGIKVKKWVGELALKRVLPCLVIVNRSSEPVKPGRRLVQLEPEIGVRSRDSQYDSLLDVPKGR